MGVFRTTSKNVCNADYHKKKQVVYRPKRMFSMAVVREHFFSTYLFDSFLFYPPKTHITMLQVKSFQTLCTQQPANVNMSSTSYIPHTHTHSYYCATVWKCSRNSEFAGELWFNVKSARSAPTPPCVCVCVRNILGRCWFLHNLRWICVSHYYFEVDGEIYGLFSSFTLRCASCAWMWVCSWF